MPQCNDRFSRKRDGRQNAQWVKMTCGVDGIWTCEHNLKKQMAWYSRYGANIVTLVFSEGID